MADNSQSSIPDLQSEEPTVLDLFKSIFKDWNSFRGFLVSAFNAARREQINRALIAEKSLAPTEEEQPWIMLQEGASAFPWRSLAGLGMALLAQYLLEPQGMVFALGTFQIEKIGRNLPMAFGLYFLAFALIGWGIFRQEWNLSPFPPERSYKASNTVRLIPFIASIVVTFIAFIGFEDNLFNAYNLTLWLLGMALFIVAVWIPYRRVRLPHSTYTRRRALWWGLLMAFSAALVIFFRVYRLGDVPSEPFSDHAEKILDVYEITQGQTSIFFVRNTGREAFQMYWTVLISWIFGTGLSFLSLKIGMALIGLLTLPYLYLLGKEVGGRRVGLLALLLTGIGYWPNVISRVGLRFPLYPMFVAPTLYYLMRGLRTRNRNDFILSGLFLGIGLHGYSPIRIMPFLVVIAVGLYLLHARSQDARKDVAQWLVLLALTSLVVFVPLLRYSLDNPEGFSYRAFSRLGSVEQPLPGPAVEIFFSNLWNALRMFNDDDGEIWVHSVTHRPALDVVSATLFLIGVLLVFVRYLRQRHWLDLILLLSIPLLAMPSILSLAFPGENPALNRAGGAYIPTFLFAALAFDGLFVAVGGQTSPNPSGRGQAKKFIGMRAGIAWGLGLLLLTASALQNYDLVFRQYARQFDSGAWNSSEMGAVIKEFGNTYGTTDTVWIVPYPHWVDTRLPGVWAGIPNRDFAMWRDNLPDTVELPGPKLFLVKANVSGSPENDQETLDVLKELYPQGRLELSSSNVEGHEFWIFFVP